MRKTIKRVLTALLAISLALGAFAAAAAAGTSSAAGAVDAAGTSAIAGASAVASAATGAAPPAPAPDGEPVITMNPADRSVSAGGTTTFSVLAEGAPVLVYTWYERDGGGVYQPITEGANRGLYSGVNSPRLTLSNVPASFDGHRYLCRVSNSGGYADSSGATLTVTASGAPVINSQPADCRIYEGGTATFTIAAAGDPAPTYQWMYLDYIGGNEWVSITDGGIYSGAHTPALTLANVPASFNGRRYLCVVSGAGIQVESNIVSLSIAAPGSPIITSQPVSRNVIEGGTAVFSVSSTGSPSPSYQWMYRDLKNDAEWFNVSDGGFFSGAATQTLTVKGVTEALDGYRFCCYLRNSAGHIQSAEVTLTVSQTGDSSPVITGPEALTLEEGYATVSSDVFIIFGAPEPSVKKTSGDAKITWNDMTRKLNIAEGLAPGVYVVTLEASTGSKTDAVFTFTLTVTEKIYSGMLNFIEKNEYERGQFADVDEAEWYGFDRDKIIVSAYVFGLMMGDGTAFNPTGRVTVAEAITIAARVHSIYTTGADDFIQGDLWYQVYVDYAIDNGIIYNDDFTVFDFTRAATRGEMAYIFSCSLPESEFEGRNTVESLPDVDDDTLFCDHILMLYRAGVLTGGDEHGTFHPGDNITRAEAAAIISRVILPEKRAADRVYAAAAADSDETEEIDVTAEDDPGAPETGDPEPGGAPALG